MGKDLLYAIEVDDKGTPVIRKFSRSLKDSDSATNRLSGTLGKADSRMGKLAKSTLKMIGRFREVGVAGGTAMASLAAYTGIKLAKSVATVGMSFEKLGVQLTTLKGAEAAKRDLSWISNFASTTPFQLDQVAQAFVKLEAYGLDGKRWMKTLGDTASSMGKGINDSVEMFADAMTGEFERLKEFGVKAKTQGDQVTFSWSQNGQDMQVTAEKTASGIGTALEGIFSRFEGGMESQSKTLEGMLSNLSDKWLEFRRLIADSGFFTFLKDNVTDLLDAVNAMAEDGTLEQWAYQISDAMISAGDTLRAYFEDITTWWLKNQKVLVESIRLIFDMVSKVASIFEYVGSGIGQAAAATANSIDEARNVEASRSFERARESYANSQTTNNTTNNTSTVVLSPAIMTGDRMAIADVTDQINQQQERMQ